MIFIIAVHLYDVRGFGNMILFSWMLVLIDVLISFASPILNMRIISYTYHRHSNQPSKAYRQSINPILR